MAFGLITYPDNIVKEHSLLYWIVIKKKLLKEGNIYG